MTTFNPEKEAIFWIILLWKLPGEFTPLTPVLPLPALELLEAGRRPEELGRFEDKVFPFMDETLEIWFELMRISFVSGRDGRLDITTDLSWRFGRVLYINEMAVFFPAGRVVVVL